nr:caffeic acid 3-O-methyltransferase-like [Tanacetum cinerariifolium]
MHLVTSTCLTMVLVSSIKLKVLDAIVEAGPHAQLSAHEIATRLLIPNQNATAMIDRMLRLLARHSVVTCAKRNHDLKLVRVYGLTPVAKYFIPNEDGVSLGLDLQIQLWKEVFRLTRSTEYVHMNIDDDARPRTLGPGREASDGRHNKMAGEPGQRLDGRHCINFQCLRNTGMGHLVDCTKLDDWMDGIGWTTRLDARHRTLGPGREASDGRHNKMAGAPGQRLDGRHCINFQVSFRSLVTCVGLGAARSFAAPRSPQSRCKPPVLVYKFSVFDGTHFPATVFSVSRSSRSYGLLLRSKLTACFRLSLPQYIEGIRSFFLATHQI